MTWHLKDRELERKLEVFSGGNFVNSLNQVIESDGIDSEFFVWVGFGRKLLGDDDKDNCLRFRTDELEEVPEYNPHAWNEYPKVKPVEPGIYRLEVKRNAGGVTRCYAAVFDFSTGKNWHIYGQCNLIDTSVLKGGYVRFRPWSED